MLRFDGSRLRNLIAWTAAPAWLICALLATAPVSAQVADPASAAAAAATAAVQAGPDRDRVQLNQRVFDRVWNEVRTEYYDPTLNGVDWRAARAAWRPRALAARDDRELYRALDQMLDLLDDQHAAASSPAVVRRRETQRTRRPVIGVTVARQDSGDYRVEVVRPGSPAAEAGVGLGWMLRVIDGGWSPEQDVVEGEPVHLVLRDEAGQVRDVTVNPRVMDPIPAFSADRSRPGVLVLRVEGFELGLGPWIGQQLADLPADVDVVLDLRNNPGGRLAEAEAVLACFLPARQAWAVRTNRSGRRETLSTDAPCGDLTAPVPNEVAVLVNGASRSSAELTPAALQEARRALIVGERTGGAVLISRDTELPDGGSLTLSRADFVTTGGVRLEKQGVTPDLTVALTADDRRAGRDPILDAAIAALAGPVEAVAATTPN
ncbi:MAG: S41 family peptidase [Pseudomonadota bacterium]